MYKRKEYNLRVAVDEISTVEYQGFQFKMKKIKLPKSLCVFFKQFWYLHYYIGLRIGFITYTNVCNHLGNPESKPDFSP